MSTRASIVTAGGLLAALLAIGLIAAEGKQPQPASTREGARAGDDKGREADRAAIREAGAAFLKAFESGDAKAVAAHWTPGGGSIAGEGPPVGGRRPLDPAYATFFPKNPKLRVEAERDSLRFPSRDTAVAEGYFKVFKDKATAPVVARFSALHVREDG